VGLCEESLDISLTLSQVPDLSAIFWVQWVIEEQVVDILSTPEYSAAIFASMVALLTNERIAAGKPGLGLLNPLLYANPQAFKDMTTGTRPDLCHPRGF
jgi:tripeptidyl-peptidase-1